MPRGRKGPFSDETEIRRQQNEKVAIGVDLFYVYNYHSRVNNGSGRYTCRNFSAATHRI
jgi:hypothetical protein